MSAAYSEAARDYFATRGIAPELAAAVGVHEQGGRLLFPCAAPDGTIYYRERSLNGGPAKVKQPPGRPLALWWPLRRSRGAEAVLVCEGESDALAALEPLAESRFAATAVVAVPGTGFPARRLAEQLGEVGARVAFLALDADEAGRGYAEKAIVALREAGIRPIVVELEDGADLAATLARVDDRTGWIDQALADAEAAADNLAASDESPEIPERRREERTNGKPPPGRDEADAKQPSQATRLVALALEEVDLFRSPDGVAFAAVRVGDHRETWPLRSKHFRTWLQRSLYVADRKVPGAQAVQDALGVLEGRALFEAPEEAVALRVAGDDTVIYLDLGDESWQSVEVSSTGWRLAEPAVRMRRSSSIVALPAPVAGGSIDTLRRFINVRDDRDWQLLVAWLVAVRPRGPYPVLVLHGEHGAAKSTVARLLRALIDPSASPLRSDPRNAHDLMIGASNGWIVAYDNLSGLPTWLSDALCRLSTGGGFATRELYSDNEETIFEAQRPVILTGIEELATRGDLLDRALVVSLPTIQESERCSERELWADFERLRPSILGALLEVAACAVRELPTTHLDAAPRMADFAEWIVAAEPALPWAAGDFLASYSGNRGEANELTLEESPIGSSVRELAQHGFEGTAEDLLERLEGIAGEAATRRKEWPKSPRALSGKLRRIAPNLRALGAEVEFAKESGRGRRRLITLGTVQGVLADGADGSDGRPRIQSRERDEQPRLGE